VRSFPESGSIEFIDQYGNHVQMVWYPVSYYKFEHFMVSDKERPLPDTGDRSLTKMSSTYQWVLKQIKKAQEVISSTVDDIEPTSKKSRGKRASKRGKRKSTRT
jgi:hypothetical protein